MKKNKLKVNSLRTIKKSFPRFISLVIMSMLGVFTFSGLQATAPDMIKTLDNYLDEYNTYDVKIISTLGLTDNDINELNNIENINAIEGINSTDVLININDKESVLNVSSITSNLNNLQLIDGRLPESNNEIIVEENLLQHNNLEIGNTIKLNDDSFKEKEVTIVGTIFSSLYFNNVSLDQARGNTSIGTGKVNYYSFMLKDNFDKDYYDAIYITIDNAKEEITSNKEYVNLIDNVIDNINAIKDERENSRYQEIYNEAKEKIDEGEKNANNKLLESKNKLATAKKELSNTLVKLDNANSKLETFKKELTNTKEILDSGKIELDNFEQSLNTMKDSISDEEYNLYLIEFQNKQQEYATNLKLYNENLETYNNQKLELEKNYKTYNYSYEEYQNSLKEYEQNKIKVENEISEAKNELNNIKKPTWFVYDRSNYSTYSEYIDGTNSITNLSKLFPTVFFAVAILISLISMNRMVEEDRLEIGTLKSLGFSNHQILTKYLMFSFLASLLGSLIGSILGLIIIPLIIFNIYGILFKVPNFTFTMNIDTTILSFIIVLICICGTSILTVYKVLREKPADLMRPKSPKKGKRVILERVKFIWNRLNFSKKVTIRNLMRYKKRGLVTIFGIAGCTALMLCGFGIRDAIIDIAEVQFNEINKFDASIYINDMDIDEISKINENENIVNMSILESISAEVNDIDVNLMVVDKETIGNVINLIDKDSDNILTLESDKVIITEKLAKLNNLNVGDTIKILDINNNYYEYIISGIVKNHLGHYIYIDTETYNNEFKPNLIYANTTKLNDEEITNLKEELLKNDNIINVSFKNNLIDSADNMLKSLNKVVAILIILAASLSFVVLYNLSNINITERKREIATLKVLGFYNKEVDNYITKENIILTFIGIIIGNILGYFLTNIVILTVEIEKASFIKHINLTSYLIASLLSVLFTLIVNIITHHNLKKINMIESLKSVE